MAYVVEVKLNDDKKTVQSGKGSGDAVFATEKEASNIAEMFSQTLEDCDATVVERGDTTPTT